MRFKILISLALIVPLSISAQQDLSRKEKSYIKTAQKLDILKYLPVSTDLNPCTFWNNVTLNNATLQKELTKFKNPSGLAKDAYDKVKRSEALLSIKNNNYNPQKEGDINNTFRSVLVGEGCAGENITFRIDHNYELNAYCTPDGFIYINDGLLEKVNGNFNMVNGILAHEVTHYMFRHHLIHEHMALKRQRANKIGAAIAVVGIGAANMAAASGGAYVDASSSYQNIIEGADEWSTAYYYRYGREEELVSDITAFRFLEWIGGDPQDYIKSLEIISGPWMGRPTDRYDDHPSAEERIGVLKALEPAPFRRTINNQDTSSETSSYDVFVCTDEIENKYHRTKECKLLKMCKGNIQKMEPEEAEDKGFERCTICY